MDLSVIPKDHDTSKEPEVSVDVIVVTLLGTHLNCPTAVVPFLSLSTALNNV